MKKHISIKIYILVALSTTSLFSSSLSSAEILKMVAEIKKERKGISLATLGSTGNPFIIKDSKKKESSEVNEVLEMPTHVEVIHTLKAILNKAAFINKKWYKKGDTLGKYKVGNILSHSVVLKSANGNKKLSLKKKKKIFIKLNRGYE